MRKRHVVAMILILSLLLPLTGEFLLAGAEGGGITERVSMASDGTQGDGDSGGSAISSDGRYVAFASGASNLIPGDTNDYCGDSGTENCRDAFVHDRETGETARVSVASDGTEANGESWPPAIGDYAYVADLWGGLQVVDVSHPASPPEVGSYDAAWTGQAVYAASGHVYVATEEGLRVMGRQASGHLEEVGRLDLEGWYEGTDDIFVVGSHAYLVGTRYGDEGLCIADVVDPTRPFEVSFTDLGEAEGVYVSGDYAYVVSEDEEIFILDVSDPSSPVWDDEGISIDCRDASDIVVSGGRAYIATGDDGLCIADVSDPGTATPMGTCDTPGWANGVAVVDGYACVADGDDGGLRVIDVSDPQNPAEAGHCDTPGEAEGIHVSGSQAYVADGEYGGIRAIEIADPADPHEVGYYDTPGAAARVFASAGYAYVADEEGGLVVIRVPGAAAQLYLPLTLRQSG